MASYSEPTVGSSPDVLCVSDNRESNTRIRDAVATYRSTATIETTTDPTVVPELVSVWNLDCVVADVDMDPLDGFELKSSLQGSVSELSVLVVSTEPAVDDASVAVVTADSSEDETLADCLDWTHSQQDAETAPIDLRCQTSRRLSGFFEADDRSVVVAQLEAVLATFPSVVAHRSWLVGADGSLEPATDAETSYSAVAPILREVIESGRPQHVTDADTIDSASTAADQAETTQTVVYPLGHEGVIVIDLVVLTPAVTARLERCTTVAGACLDQQAEITTLENRVRQIADRNRTLSQFARTVAHDLSSPLSVIYGRLELAAAEQSSADMHLQAARNAAERVDSLITDHLQSIAVDAETEHEDVSIQTVAIQAWRIIDPSTARLQVEPQLETVEANGIRLQQLFENLIRNAIEHGSEESIGLGSADSHDPHAVFDDDTDSVTVTIKPTANGFAVCDNGPGIPRAERETIFESGYTTTESGSGLGLHIVDEIVDAHGWDISVTDSASGGARFEIDTD